MIKKIMYVSLCLISLAHCSEMTVPIINETDVPVDIISDTTYGVEGKLNLASNSRGNLTLTSKMPKKDKRDEVLIKVYSKGFSPGEELMKWGSFKPRKIRKRLDLSFKT